MTDGTIRVARPQDVAEILLMVRELAEYERAADQAVATEDQLHDALFGDRPSVFAHVVEHEVGDRALGGFALWFRNFSTWVGRHGIYLEDLYVRPEVRGFGYGRRLLATLAAECVEHGYGRLDWWVLDWNTPSREFYESHGAVALTEWVPYRVTGPNLARLAAAGLDHSDLSDLDAG